MAKKRKNRPNRGGGTALAAAPPPGKGKSGASNYTLPTTTLAGKARGKQPSSEVKSGQSIQNKLGQYAATAIAAVRTRTDVYDIIRTLMREDGLFSSATNSMVALASKSGYRIAGFGPDGSMDLGVMSAAYNIIDQIDTSHDYTEGFNDKQSLQSLLATLMIDTIGSGGCGAELVLDPNFGPDKLLPLGYSTITWMADGKGGRWPAQDGGKTKLDFPTIFIAEHNRNADEGYSVSQLRPGISQTFQFNEFLEDTHRSVNRTGHSRMIVTLDQEAVRKMAPPDIAGDQAKMAAFFTSVKSSVEDALKDLEPEDALVAFNSVTAKIEDTGGTKSDYSSLLTTLGNLLGVSLKTPASVSGLRASGTQGLSNAETLIYLKVVEASKPPTEQVLSRALTLAVRLLGIDGYVRFELNPINLRPEIELEAYKLAKQNRILQLLSLGIISDAVACYELGQRPQDFKVTLAGTGFFAAKSAGNAPVDRTTSAGKALNPGTPASPGGKN